MSKPKDNTASELVHVQPNPIAHYDEIPDFMKSDWGNQVGMEDVERSDITLPRLGLCQALSPQKRKNHPSYIENLQEGQLFNSVTGEIYGEEVEIVILFFFKNRIKFFDINEGGGIDCTSPNAIDGGRIHPEGCSSCQYSAWGNGRMDEESQSAPECTLYHNYMCFIPKDMTPIALSYKSTGLKDSKQFLAQQRLSRLPMYAKKIKVSVATRQDGQNEWFVPKMTSSGFVDQDVYKQMEANFKSLKEMNITVDTTGESEVKSDASPF